MSRGNKKGGGGRGQQTPRTPWNQRRGDPNNPPSPSSPDPNDPNATAGGDPNATMTTTGNQTGGVPAPAPPPGGANTQTGAPAPAPTTGNQTNVGGAPAPAPALPGGAPTTQTGGAPAPPIAVAFALNPGVAMGNVILDYNQKTAKWLYDNTVKSLYSEPKDKFELLQPQVPTFLTKTALRLALVGSSILHIFSQLRNICQCHVEYTLAEFRIKATTYIGTPTRLAQDDDTFAAMLWNSISDSAIAVMALKASDYTINGVISGLVLFKCLLINSKV